MPGCDKESGSPERSSWNGAEEGTPPYALFAGWELSLVLPLRLAAGQFLDLRLLRSTRILAGLQWLVRLAFLASGAFRRLAFFSAEFCRVCHELFLQMIL